MISKIGLEIAGGRYTYFQTNSPLRVHQSCKLLLEQTIFWLNQNEGYPLYFRKGTVNFILSQFQRRTVCNTHSFQKPQFNGIFCLPESELLPLMPWRILPLTHVSFIARQVGKCHLGPFVMVVQIWSLYCHWEVKRYYCKIVLPCLAPVCNDRN